MQRIPEHEFVITFARSGGKGGQNVNKTSTKAIVHWAIGPSHAFTYEEKMRIRQKLHTRLTNSDELVVMCEEERSQPQNRAKAIARLQSLVVAAAKAPKKRTATKPTRSSKLKRLDTKKKHSTAKKARRGSFDFFS